MRNITSWKIGGRLKSGAKSGLFHSYLLHAPIDQFADIQNILGPAIDGIYGAKLFHKMTGPAKLPNNGSVQFHLVKFAMLEVIRIIRIGAVQILMRSQRNTD